MKKSQLVSFISLLFIFAFKNAQAQKDSSGVNLTAYDFSVKKLSYAINCKTEKHKIKLNDFFGKDYITVVHNNISYNLSKDSVYGFKSCDGSTYRLADKVEYTVLNPNDTLVLYQFIPLSTPKNPREPVYKFSIGNGFMQDLTIQNIKNIFPGNHSFHDDIDTHFRRNSSLVNYDNFHKWFKVVMIFNKYNPK